MYLKEITDKDTYDNLKTGSCMICGLIPKFRKELKHNGVVTTISFNENVGWSFKVDTESKKMEYCYCPLCTRKMKLLKLKGKL